jgi:hypothetical protein
MSGVELTPPRAAQIVRLVLLGCSVMLLVPVALEQSVGLGEVESAWTKHGLVSGEMFGAALACAARAVLVQPERIAWTLLALGITGYAVGQVYWTVWLEQLAEPPFPSIADGLWLAVYPLAFVALVLIARSRLRGFRTGIWIDGVLAGAALAALWQAVAFEPILAGGAGLDTLASATLLAYPFGDLLLVGLVVGVFALSGWSPGPSWLLLGGGFVLFAAADTVYNAMIANGELVVPMSLTVLWPLGLLTVGLAAWLPAERHSARADGPRGLLIPVRGHGGGSRRPRSRLREARELGRDRPRRRCHRRGDRARVLHPP